MAEEIAKLEIDNLILDISNKIKALKDSKPFLNDIYHDILKLKKRIDEEFKNLKNTKNEIIKKLSSKEFEFISVNFNLNKEDFMPEKYRSFKQLEDFLRVKTYHAYSWDFFLEPWIKYFEIKDKINLLINELNNKVKLINFYTKN